MNSNMFFDPVYRKENLRIIKLLGKGKSARSYLTEIGGHFVVLKEMHNEKISYYHFSRPKTELECEAYRTLQSLPIAIPKLLYLDHHQQYLVKEYIDGPTVAEAMLHGPLQNELFRSIFQWSKVLKSHNLNIDYFPTNFVIRDKQPVYIDYECNGYEEQWDFESWGIYYWLNHEGFSEFLKTGDANFINQPGTPYPIRNKTIGNRKKQIMKILQGA
ncbi:MAG: hypothetical protein Kow00108_02810 [Calditrichia bacterium]